MIFQMAVMQSAKMQGKESKQEKKEWYAMGGGEGGGVGQGHMHYKALTKYSY